MPDFKAQMRTYIDALERALPRLLPQDAGLAKPVADAMAYSLLSGGKRVRGVLTLACYSLLQKDFSAAVPFAAALEMVHAYSLIHDDLPCMDDDDMRRGKPACHIAHGEATALLAGDGLLTLAFETLSGPENGQAFGAEKTLEAVWILSRAAGAGGMIGGQIIDLENENREVTLETLMLTDAKKTGALIRAACEIGCVLGGADSRALEAIKTYADKIGLAFQVVDDVLDVVADEKQLGKPTGSDSGNNRTTYASLYGVERAGQIARQLTDEAIAAVKNTGFDTAFLCDFAENLAARAY